MNANKVIDIMQGIRKLTGRGPARDWRGAAAAAALALAMLGSAGGAAQAAPATSGGGAQGSQQPALDPAQIVSSQIQLGGGGRPYDTGLLSEGFKAAYDEVPKNEDNLPPSVFSFGYDRPQRVVRVSDVRSDPADPNKATARVVIHFTNEDAPVPSFDRETLVTFSKEDDRWLIDDVRLTDIERMPGWNGRPFSVKGSFSKLAPPVPAGCAARPPIGGKPDGRAIAAGYSPLRGIGQHLDDPNRQTIADRFVKAIGSACPFTYRLVDLNGDGLSDLVLQLSDRKLGATDDGLRRTAVYALDKQGKWQPMIDGLASGVMLRKGASGGIDIAFSGDGPYKSWRKQGEAFAPVRE